MTGPIGQVSPDLVLVLSSGCLMQQVTINLMLRVHQVSPRSAMQPVTINLMQWVLQESPRSAMQQVTINLMRQSNLWWWSPRRRRRMGRTTTMGRLLRQSNLLTNEADT